MLVPRACKLPCWRTRNWWSFTMKKPMPVLLWVTSIWVRSKKLIPGLNAAFVDVGFEKDAFLHYTDLSPYAKSLLKFTHISINTPVQSQQDFAHFTVEPEIVKTGKINEVLGQKPNVLVQILITHCCEGSPSEL